MRRAGLLLAVVVLLAGIDLGTKYAVGPYGVDPPPAAERPFFRIEPACNPGGLGGLLPASNLLWTAFGFAVTGVVVYLLLARREARHPALLDLALAVILAGALGNLWDRLLYGAVRDFLAFHFRLGSRSFSYPTFNLADAYLVVGVGLYVLARPRGRERGADAEKAPPEPPEPQRPQDSGEAGGAGEAV